MEIRGGIATGESTAKLLEAHQEGPQLCLITQRAKGRNTSLDPVFVVAKHDLRVRFRHERRPEAAGFIRRHLQPQHEVGGVAGGGQHAAPAQDFVHWATVNALGRDGAVLDRVVQHCRHGRKELLWPRVCNNMLVAVPSGALEIKPVSVGTCFGFRFLEEDFRRLFGEFVTEPYGVNRHFHLPCVVLLNGRQEPLGEEEATDPICRRKAFVDPLPDESLSGGRPGSRQEIGKPRLQRFQ